MKILFVGDVVGAPGRRAVRTLVPSLKAKHGFDFVVANGENSAGGSGITMDTAGEIFSAGVDIITSGDHVWDQRDVMNLINAEMRFLRPINYPSGTPGRGSAVVRINELPPIGVLNVQGRTFMNPPLDHPFLVARAEVANLHKETNIILVDFHAEATSEKIAFTRYLDGEVTAVIGTHTHVQTADEQIFPKGTAYLSDAGFTGPHDSVLGREVEPVIQKFLTGMPQRFGVAKGRVLLQGALIEVDAQTGKAMGIQRISEALPT